MTEFQPSFLPLVDYLKLPRPLQTWLMQPLLPAGGLASLFGAPKSAKTFAALGMSEAIGDPSLHDWLHFPVRQHGQVLYLQLDTPRSIWSERLALLMKHGHQFRGVAFADRESQGVAYPWNIHDPDCENWLREQVAYFKPALVVYDTLRQVHKMDEDKASLMAPVMETLIRACGQAAILMVSHTRKENIMATRLPPLEDEGRGSNFLATIADCLMHLSSRGHDTRLLRVKGRAPWPPDSAREEFRLKVVQDSHTGLLLAPRDAIADAVTALEGEGLSGRQLAKEVAKEVGMEEEAVRSYLRRHKP